MPAAEPAERERLGPVLGPSGPAGTDEQRREPSIVAPSDGEGPFEVVAELVPIHDRDEQIPV
jgi:hypothetical protein